MKLCIFESLKGPPDALAVGFLSLRSVITAAKGFQLVNVRAVFAKPPFPTMGLLRQSALRRRNFCYWAGAVLPAAFQSGRSLLAGRGDRVAPDACVHAGRPPHSSAVPWVCRVHCCTRRQGRPGRPQKPGVSPRRKSPQRAGFAITEGQFRWCRDLYNCL